MKKEKDYRMTATELVELNSENIDDLYETKLDKSEVPDIDNLETKTDHDKDISTLDKRIQGNTDHIFGIAVSNTANTKNISTNTTNIASVTDTANKNAAQVKGLRNDLSTTVSRVYQNEVDIATNTKDIATNKEVIATKQDSLVSGKNIATINGNDLTKGGDIEIKGGESVGNVTYGDDLTKPVALQPLLDNKQDKLKLYSEETETTKDKKPLSKIKIADDNANYVDLTFGDKVESIYKIYPEINMQVTGRDSYGSGHGNGGMVIDSDKIVFNVGSGAGNNSKITFTYGSLVADYSFDDKIPRDTSSFITWQVVDANVLRPLKTSLNTKQDALVSGKNIATINGNDLTKGGNIEIKGGGESVGNVTYGDDLTKPIALQPLLDTKQDKLAYYEESTEDKYTQISCGVDTPSPTRFALSGNDDIALIASGSGLIAFEKGNKLSVGLSDGGPSKLYTLTIDEKGVTADKLFTPQTDNDFVQKGYVDNKQKQLISEIASLKQTIVELQAKIK